MGTSCMMYGHVCEVERRASQECLEQISWKLRSEDTRQCEILKGVGA